MPKISVVVPVYNVEDYLSECIESIINQSFKDFKLILIDDGSTDKSSQILTKYREEYPNMIKLITQENQGVSVARNIGLEESTGEYLAFVDSDDYLEEEALELMYENAIKSESDLVLCNARVVDESGEFQKIWKSGQFIKQIENIFSNKSLINTILPAPWGKLYKKALFVDNEIKFPVGLRNQDLGTTPRILSYCDSISKVNRALYNYRYRTESAMRTYDYKILDVAKNLQIVKRHYESLELLDKFYHEIEYLFIEHLMFRGMYRVKNVDDITLREELMGNICEILNKEFPNWHDNKYISKLPIKKRIYLHMVYRGNIDRVMTGFRIKKRIFNR